MFFLAAFFGGARGGRRGASRSCRALCGDRPAGQSRRARDRGRRRGARRRPSTARTFTVRATIRNLGDARAPDAAACGGARRRRAPVGAFGFDPPAKTIAGRPDACRSSSSSATCRRSADGGDVRFLRRGETLAAAGDGAARRRNERSRRGSVKPLFSAEEIAARVTELAREIAASEPKRPSRRHRPERRLRVRRRSGARAGAGGRAAGDRVHLAVELRLAAEDLRRGARRARHRGAGRGPRRAHRRRRARFRADAEIRPRSHAFRAARGGRRSPP